MGIDEFFRKVRDVIPYGSYVMVGKVVRVETMDQAIIAQVLLSE